MKKIITVTLGILIVATLIGRQLYRAGYQIGYGMGTANVREIDALNASLQCNLDAALQRAERLNEMMTFVGIASWYGDAEHGKPTSLGKPFNKNALTAASKFLPYHSYWLVTNLENGKQVGVWITDDGPNIKGDKRIGRFLDLSEAAARRLDMKTRGVVLTSISPMIAKPSTGD